MSIPEIFSEIDKIVGRFDADIEELKKKLTANQTAKTAAKPAGYVQPDLFDQQTQRLGVRPKFGDAGYENEYNPIRQAIGAMRKADCGKRAASPDRRRNGTVNVAAMDVNQHREYWRWCAARKKARRMSAAVPSWDTWKACVCR